MGTALRDITFDREGSRPCVAAAGPLTGPICDFFDCSETHAIYAAEHYAGFLVTGDWFGI
jgi:hypothetical protein